MIEALKNGTVLYILFLATGQLVFYFLIFMFLCLETPRLLIGKFKINTSPFFSLSIQYSINLQWKYIEDKLKYVGTFITD